MFASAALPALAGGAYNMINSFLNPQKGYEKASDQAQKYYLDAQGKLKILSDQGQEQYGRLNNQANALGNPTQLENDWSSGYSMSPYAKQTLDQAKTSGLDAASSAGLLGSSATLGNIENTAGNIMQGDRQSYMDDLMNKYMASAGIGQNIYGIGANSAINSSNNSMNEGTTEGHLAFGKQNAPGDFLSKILGGVANYGINYATGEIGHNLANASKNAASY